MKSMTFLPHESQSCRPCCRRRPPWSWPSAQPDPWLTPAHTVRTHDNYRRGGKGRRCCLGHRMYSIPCRASYFAPGWYEEKRIHQGRFEEKDEFIQDDLKKKMNSSRTIWRKGWIHPGRFEEKDEFIQFLLIKTVFQKMLLERIKLKKGNVKRKT